MTATRELERHRTFDNPADLVAYSSTIGNGFVAPFQVTYEIVALLNEVKRVKPKLVMEIGTANGGTLFLLTRTAPPDARIISLDLPGGIHGEGYATWRTAVYERFALPGQKIDLVRMDSHQPSTVEHIKRLLGGKQLDVLFIDGDHTYDGVRKDYEMYSPLVRPGGLIAFHDIAAHDDESCQVSRFWNEVKQGKDATEWIENRSQGWAGIGAIRAS